MSFSVTRRKLQLGSRDATTGWYDSGFVESTIDMPIVTAEAAKKAVSAGVHVTHDMIGYTQDPLVEGDEVEDAGVYYHVEAVKPIKLGDSFIYRECQLSLMPYHS